MNITEYQKAVLMDTVRVYLEDRDAFSDPETYTPEKEVLEQLIKGGPND